MVRLARFKGIRPKSLDRRLGDPKVATERLLAQTLITPMSTAFRGQQLAASEWANGSTSKVTPLWQAEDGLVLRAQENPGRQSGTAV
jgi:hypothetical protein